LSTSSDPIVDFNLAPWNSTRKKSKLNPPRRPRRINRQKFSAYFNYSKKLEKRAIRSRNYIPNIGTPPNALSG
jgi:hypothetical protein